MRSNREFHPEWGYLTPTRAAMRIALVSAAIGATASAAVVFSLVDGPVAEEQSVAARTLAPANLSSCQRAVAARAAASSGAGYHAGGEPSRRHNPGYPDTGECGPERGVRQLSREFDSATAVEHGRARKAYCLVDRRYRRVHWAIFEFSCLLIRNTARFIIRMQQSVD